MTHAPRVPAHLEPYVRILGPDQAVAFLMTYGGGELYLARNPDPTSPLVQLIGLEAARTLGAAADRLPRRVPTAKPWLAQVLKSQGLSVTEIARRLHVTDVTVRSWLARADGRRGARAAPDARQMPLI